ncbi:Type-4 uracil-DNA glycosylase [Metallosphaera sp. J1]|uniref:type-4 uracil-DNA glycosylase n=1 Tax=Metallosphaera javensis (ex Hofmann et al. 2022) TaxID=99938 RepID=UPI001EE0D87D|nr:type-4 uracil-DNA glycosylase [Metallosphaera javensis (ex Hofmann et al. 2022)]MCG3108546.1 Type-4 uracil-DNA glycosylase [Metallosphaera javensis (ex Hofmann et al. 2022)]
MSSLQDIDNQVINCHKCSLSGTRTHAVPGEGNPSSDVVFVGEAPGAREDETGRPFVGSAGQLLNDLIRKYLGRDRSQVYITNVVKCRPPNNRDPEKEEIEACSPYLVAQIKLIKPKVIVTLGRHSTGFLQTLAGVPLTPISRCHGKPFNMDLGFGVVIIFPTYHPAAALYNPPLRRDLEEDFQKLSRLVTTGSKAITLDKFLDLDGSGNKG